jgi:uncharacterized membrane protein YqaE (UPF0057 family)
VHFSKGLFDFIIYVCLFVYLFIVGIFHMGNVYSQAEVSPSVMVI